MGCDRQLLTLVRAQGYSVGSLHCFLLMGFHSFVMHIAGRLVYQCLACCVKVHVEHIIRRTKVSLQK